MELCRDKTVQAILAESTPDKRIKIENLGATLSVLFLIKKLGGVKATDLKSQAQALTTGYCNVRKRVEQEYANEPHDVLYRSPAFMGKLLHNFKDPKSLKPVGQIVKIKHAPLPRRTKRKSSQGAAFAAQAPILISLGSVNKLQSMKSFEHSKVLH